MEVVKQVQGQKKDQKVTHRQGFGHTTLMQQPLLFTRKLGHPELVFNDTRVSQTHFDSNAPQKWTLAENDGCWVCHQWKYCMIFVDRANFSKYYDMITKPSVIQYLKE